MLVYSTTDLLEAAELSEGMFNAYTNRGTFVPESGRHGTGRAFRLTRNDVLQAAFIRAAGGIGVRPRVAAGYWQMIDADPNPATLVLVRLAGRAVVFNLAKEDVLPEHTEAVHVRPLMLRIAARLAQMDARRAATDPAAYPFRRPFFAPNPAAPWSIALAEEPGELDLETIARLQDAIEARSNLLLAARSAEALAALVEVVHRLLSAAAPVSVH